MISIGQVREPYTAVRLLCAVLELPRQYNLTWREHEEADEAAGELSPLGLCTALAAKRGYRLNRGRGAPDPHRAGLEVYM